MATLRTASVWPRNTLTQRPSCQSRIVLSAEAAAGEAGGAPRRTGEEDGRRDRTRAPNGLAVSLEGSALDAALPHLGGPVPRARHELALGGEGEEADVLRVADERANRRRVRHVIEVDDTVGAAAGDERRAVGAVRRRDGHGVDKAAVLAHLALRLGGAVGGERPHLDGAVARRAREHTAAAWPARHRDGLYLHVSARRPVRVRRQRARQCR